MLQIITTRNFKSISQQQIEWGDANFIVKKALGEKAILKSIETTKQGDVNSSYILNVENPTVKLFLKVEGEKNIPRFYFGQIQRELEGIRLCREASIPCAEIIGYDTSCKDIGRKYILTEFIDSTLLSTKWEILNQNQRLNVKQEMLDIVGKMQKIKSAWFGDIFEDGIIGRYSEWSEAFKSLVDIAVNDCLNLNTLNTTEAVFIREAARVCSKNLKMGYDACFNHMDIHWHNVFISNDSSVIKIKGIIDFGSSLFAPSFSDEFRLNNGFLYGTEKFYDEKIEPTYTLSLNEEFSAGILSMLDYYVFLSIIGEYNGEREGIINRCKDFIGSY